VTGGGRPQGHEHARRGNALLAIVSGGAFLASFDGAAVAVALPSISRSLGLGYAQALWVPTLYLLVVAGLLLPAGRSADRHGRMTYYAIGLGLFCAGSVAASCAPGQWWLYAGRCCQGAGGALIVTTSAALAVAASTPQRRGRSLGFNTLCVYLGAATGPALGGLLVTAFGWRSIFMLSAVSAALLLGAIRISGAAKRVGPNDRDRSTGKVNVMSALTFAVAIAALLLLLTFGPMWGWSSWRAVLTAVVAGAGLILVVLRETHGSRPLVGHELYRGNRLFVAACAAALLVYAGIFAAGLLTAIDLQVVQGLGAGVTGLILLAQPVTMALLAPLAGRWYDRIGSRALTTIGSLTMALGALVLASTEPADSWPRAAAGLAVIGLGLGLFSTPNISAVLGSVPRSRLSVASAVLGTNRFVGQALSVSILGSIAASSLAGAGGRSLSAQIAATGGASAFHEGFRWAMAVGAGIVLLAALVSSRRGPHEAAGRPSAEAQRSAATPDQDSRTSAT
jgi:EmrB/QacA subfamily drug resistance transporter